MKIVFFVEMIASAVGGAERSLMNLASDLSRRGHAVTLATHGVHKGPPHFDLAPGVDIVDLNPAAVLPPPPDAAPAPRATVTTEAPASPPAGLSGWKALRRRLELENRTLRRLGQDFSAPYRQVVGRFAALLRRRRPDVAVAWMPYAGRFVAAAAARTGTPCVMSLRSTPERDFRRVDDPKKAIEIARLADALPRYDAVTYLMPEFDALLPASVPRARRHCIPNPVSLDRVDFNGAPALADRPLRIATVGRLMRDKRQDLLISAFARLADRFPEWRLDLYGGGSFEDGLRAQTVAAGIDDRVVFQNHVKDINRIYQNASIFCFPTRYEGMPNALVEAMTAGLPCVGVDDCHSVVSFLKDGVGVLTPSARAADGLADALGELMADVDLRERYGAAARARAVALSDRDPHAEWEALLLRLSGA